MAVLNHLFLIAFSLDNWTGMYLLWKIVAGELSSMCSIVKYSYVY